MLLRTCVGSNLKHLVLTHENPLATDGLTLGTSPRDTQHHHRRRQSGDRGGKSMAAPFIRPSGREIGQTDGPMRPDALSPTPPARHRGEERLPEMGTTGSKRKGSQTKNNTQVFWDPLRRANECFRPVFEAAFERLLYRRADLEICGSPTPQIMRFRCVSEVVPHRSPSAPTGPGAWLVPRFLWHLWRAKGTRVNGPGGRGFALDSAPGQPATAVSCTSMSLSRQV